GRRAGAAGPLAGQACGSADAHAGDRQHQTGCRTDQGEGTPMTTSGPGAGSDRTGHGADVRTAAESEPGTVQEGTDRGAANEADPEVLREEIAQTRQELGDTVEALAAKADVKDRMRQTAQ